MMMMMMIMTWMIMTMVDLMVKVLRIVAKGESCLLEC